MEVFGDIDGGDGDEGMDFGVADVAGDDFGDHFFEKGVEDGLYVS